MPVTEIELDARTWQGWDDLFDALLSALGAPDWHGRNFNALIDSMITGGINDVTPPYRISVTGLHSAAPDTAAIVREAFADLSRYAREHFDPDAVAIDLSSDAAIILVTRNRVDP